jgi:hypothetical protein
LISVPWQEFGKTLDYGNSGQGDGTAVWGGHRRRTPPSGIAGLPPMTTPVRSPTLSLPVPYRQAPQVKGSEANSLAYFFYLSVFSQPFLYAALSSEIFFIPPEDQVVRSSTIPCGGLYPLSLERSRSPSL